MLVQQAVPQPAEEEQASTRAQLSSAGRYPPGFVPARASQRRQKGKGRASKPVLQQPVASSVLPCLHKLELHITGWQFYFYTGDLAPAILCAHPLSLADCSK